MHPSHSSPQSDGHDQGKDDPGSNAGGRSRTTGIAAAVSGFFKRVFKNRAFLLFLAFFVLYNLTLQTSYTRDTMPNMYLPLSMVKHGSISLSFFPELYAAGRPYFIVPYNGGMHSIFGIGAPLFALPFYLPFLLLKCTPSFTTLIYVSKFAASFYVAFSVALLYAALRRVTREKWAVIIALIYGLATPAFATSSQALWQHAPSQFLICLTIYLLIRGEERRGLTALAGLPLGLSVLVRTTNLAFILPVLIYIVWKRRSQLLGFAAALLPGALITAWYNHAAYGAFYRFPLMAPEYLLPASEFSKYNESGGYWQTPFLNGFWGNLISPSRGLLVISPILLLAFAGFVLLIWKRKELWEKTFALYLCFALAFLFELLLISKKTAWTGGLSFGNRLLLDTLPFLCFLFVPAFEYYDKMMKPSWKTAAKSMFIVLLLISLLFQVEGIVSYDRGSWNMQGAAEDLAWNVSDGQIAFYIRNPHAVTPPLIKQWRDEPANLDSFGMDIFDGWPHLYFSLAEQARLRVYIIPPGGNEKIFLVEIDGMKGRNDIQINPGDLDLLESFDDIESLKELIESSPSYEVVVIDPLIGVSKTYIFQP
jgi:hypothetical protein